MAPVPSDIDPLTAMRVLPLAVLLVLAGCDAVFGSGGVSLATDGDAYARGAVATLTLRNSSDETASMDPLECARLDRRADGGWARDPDGNDRVCGRVIVNVPAGDELTAGATLEGVGAGTYRFVQETSVGDAVSGSFEVR